MNMHMLSLWILLISVGLLTFFCVFSPIIPRPYSRRVVCRWGCGLLFTLLVSLALYDRFGASLSLALYYQEKHQAVLIQKQLNQLKGSQQVIQQLKIIPNLNCFLKK